jgi:RNA polymerase sigma-70 factor (ECF subfamily)
VTENAPARSPAADGLLELYPAALPQVYGFLLARCHDASTAEDLTAETFMAAVRAVRESGVEDVSVGWLIVVARRRLVDHWRRLERERRSLHLVQGYAEDAVDPWDEVVDVEVARGALERLRPNYRAVLTLRYLDGLSVPEVADAIGRSVHATEGLLQRARAALRHVYAQGASDEA